MSDASAIDRVKDFVFGMGYEAENDEIAEAVLKVESELAALRYVADFYAGRTRAWRTEAFRLAAKTGESMYERAGYNHAALLNAARAALAAAGESQ